MKRPDCIRHWREVEGADDSTYPDSDELFAIGAPLARKLGLGRLGIHHERLPPGRRTSNLGVSWSEPDARIPKFGGGWGRSGRECGRAVMEGAPA